MRLLSLRRVPVLAALLVLGFAGPAAAQTPPPEGLRLVGEAIAAEQAGDKLKARQLMEEAAATGHPDAVSGLATFVNMGVGGPRDPARARELFERAVAQGSAVAKLNLGIQLMGDPLPANQARAAVLLKDAAADSRLANATLYPRGRMALLGIGGPADLALGATLLEESLKTGPRNADALFLVGRAYQNGWGGRPVDAAKAYDHFRRSAELGDARAQRSAGEALLSGVGVAPDPRAAFDFFDRSAKGGDRSGMIHTAVMLATGEAGVPKDQLRARDLYRRAAEMGSPHALRGWGAMLLIGEGGAVELDRAVAYLEVAAAAGDENAKVILTRLTELTAKARRGEVDRIKAEWNAAHPRMTLP